MAENKTDTGLDNITCSKCGYILCNEDLFCPECGNPVNSSDNYVNTDKSTIVVKKKPKNSDKKGPAIALLIVFILTIVLTIASYLYIIPEVNYQKAKKDMNNKKYDSAISGFEKLKDYKNSEELIINCNYLEAGDLVKKGEYEKAIELYKNISNYKDSKKLIVECNYQLACKEYENKNFIEAIKAFEEIKDYKDSSNKINDCKYNYIKENYNVSDMDTYNYLNDLTKIDYLDCAKLKEELYKWKISVVVNSDIEDETTDLTEIKKSEPVIFHMHLTGGKPNEKFKFLVKCSTPNGKNTEHTFTNESDSGTVSWYGFNKGLYTNPKNGQSGTMKCDFYNSYTNEFLGTKSVKIID